MKKNKKRDIKKMSISVEDYGAFPLWAHYKSIHDLNRSVEFKFHEEPEMYEVVDDTAGKLTGEIVDIDDFHDFRQKHGLLIELSAVYERDDTEEYVKQETERLMEINRQKEMNK